MKSFLALTLFVGVALSSGSSAYFGWTPNHELVYRFESEVLSGLPEIRRNQYAGLKLSSSVLVQTKSDQSLIVKFVEPKFLIVNGELRMREGRPLIPAPKQEIPEHLLHHLTKPFLVHLKRGLVERFYVEEDEPVVVSNIKKSLLAQLQMDLTASRRSELLKTNMIPQGSDKEILEGGLEGKTFFTTQETSLNGDCQTDYNMYPLPKYQSQSLEAQWKEEEKELRSMNIIQGSESYGEEVCKGKQYWNIVKTENFDNCRQRPIFVSHKGAQLACDQSKAECKDLYTMAASTKYVVCGTPERFTIREVITENTGVFNTLAINTEKSINTARVTLFLLKSKTSGFSPLPNPSQAKAKTSLIMEYPLLNEWSTESSIKTLSGEENEFTPLRPVPNRHSPDFVYPSSMTPSEIKQQVVRELESIVESIGSQENSGMGSKTTNKIGAIVTELRYLNFEELRSLQSEMESIFGHSSELKKVVGKQLFHDILASVGTNPAITLMKEELEQGSVAEKQRLQVVQSLIRDVRTPSKEILGDLISLVKTLKGNGPTNIFYSAINQLSTLFYRACVDTSTSVSSFPVRIYGRFCSKDSSVLVEKYIPYLTAELERTESNGQRLAIISALGKTGSKKALIPITKAIEGHFTNKPIVRSLAVYSLRRIAKQEPTLVKPIILSLIDNLAENTEVRIAAVSVLPYCQPSTAELQKIAVRSWFEPSKQVTSFIYTTLKGLPETEVPELKPVGLKCRKVLSLVKPFQYGIQFSHNTHLVNFVKSIRLSGGIQTSNVKTAESLIPARSAISFNLYGAGLWEIKRLDLTVYTQGMDAVLEKIISLVDGHEVSSEVESELRNIKEKLNIKRRGVVGEQTPELFTQYRMFDLERINSIKMSDLVEELASSLRTGAGYGSKSIMNINTVIPISGEMLMPTSSGFALVFKTIIPVVFGAKPMGSARGVEMSLSGFTMKVNPFFNVLVTSNIGVRCPFTKQFIGSGAELSIRTSMPLEVKAELNSQMQVTVSMKTPEEVSGEVELFHAKTRTYTVVKNCKNLTPIEESSNLKEIRTGKPEKRISYPLGRKAGIHAKIEVKTDYKVYDFAYVMNLLTEQKLAGEGLIPKSLKHFSLRLTFNPTQSETKEIKMKFNLISGRNTESGLELVRPIGSILSGIQGSSSLKSGLSYSSSEEIRHICKENHSSPSKIEACIEKHERIEESIRLVEEEKREIEEICDSIRYGEESKNQCRKAMQVCHKAKVICEEAGRVSGECSERKQECISLKKSVESVRSLGKRLNQQVQAEEISSSASLESIVSGIAIHTSLHQNHGVKKTASVVIVGGVSQKGRSIRTATDIICQTTEGPRYEVELRTATTMPEVLYRWNLNALLEQQIDMSFNADLTCGRVGQPKTKMTLRSAWKKSERQQSEVRSSPEYKKCKEEERQSHPLSSVCMEARHQAASVDTVRVELDFPKFVVHSNPMMVKIVNGIKSCVLSNLVLFRSNEEESIESLPTLGGSKYGPREKVILETYFSRDGSAASMTLRAGNGQVYNLKNVRVPLPVRGFMPLSVRNGVTNRLVQKMSHSQAPASCSIDHSFVNTFDNRTYGYELNECEHLLFKDCSGMRPVAVTAAKEGGNTKIVTILAGPHKVVMKPASSIGGAVDIYVDGRLERISHNEEYTRKSSVNGKVVLRVYRHKDGVVSVENPIEQVKVFFDNKRIEIVAPQLFHNRACGLCGDLNLENTADLKSPEKCLFREDRFAAYSYMIKSQRCSSERIPSKDRSNYERDLSECVKSRSVITPVARLTRQLLERSPKPITVKHLIHREATRMCLSKKLQKVCTSGSSHGQSAEVSMPFVCFKKPSSKAEQLLKRAEAGEVLSEVMSRPTMFSKKMVVIVTCGEEPYLPIHSIFEERESSSNYKTGGRGY